ncbi:MAG: DEAD/DEAH box helicase [Saprospirales bacterium]|nr:DEAD/DEAH box helicase [Saprospirales bacterium]
MNFDQLGLIEPLLRAVKSEGYTTPTPIQVQAIPLVLEGKDLLGCAQTGTGKTAAFGLPILQLLSQKGPTPQGARRPIRCLILTPTRELALQISESFTVYGKNLPLRNLVIFGGVGQKPQTDALQRGTDILVATPGRLLDLMQQGFINLGHIEIFVLDEADRMLDMGFVHDVRRVLAKLPAKRQSLFFSATMAPEILKLASGILTSPEHVAVTPVSTTAETVGQSVYFVEKSDKKNLLVYLLKNPAIESALIFTRTKHGANKLAKDLDKAGVYAEAIHGNKSQQARVRALQGFKNRTIRVLVATDIAARGIDIDDLTHVFNYELPNVPETYVHRIGRTGRAGASGTAISFCDTEERAYLKDIQQLIGLHVPVVGGHPFEPANTAPVPLLPSKANARRLPPRGCKPTGRQHPPGRLAATVTHKATLQKDATANAEIGGVTEAPDQ